MTQLKASEQMHAVASEEQQKEANIKEALEEQLAQVGVMYIKINKQNTQVPFL